MRHERISAHESYSKTGIAAAWPTSPQIAPIPIPEPQPEHCDQVATAAAPDVPSSVGKMIIGCYAALIMAFALATAESRESIFMISISALFVVAFFTVPRLMLAQEAKSPGRPGLDLFLDRGLETLTGHSSGKDALVQMMIVPVFLTLAILAMGIAAAFIF